MDVESQMEAKGLPTHFGQTSDDHVPDEPTKPPNPGASIPNSEAAVSPQTDLKQSAAPVTVTSESEAPESEMSHPTEATTNGIMSAGVSTAQNGLPAISESGQEVPVPDSQQPPVPEPSLPSTQAGPTASNINSSFGESVIPSSIPPEIQSSMSTTESTQPIMDTAAESSSVPQPPVSDLRSPPHADKLAPSEVAQVEAEKHAEDNAADTVMPDPTPTAEPAPFVESTATSKLDQIGLVTPPTQTPPPAPQPAPAELPEPIERPPEPTPESHPPTISKQEPPEPVPTPAVPLPAAEIQDQEMIDAPPAASKVARERDDDQLDVEPAAKRQRTDEPAEPAEASEFKRPDMPSPASPTQATETPAPADAVADGDDSVTGPRLAHMKKVISNLKKSNASTAFRLPVDYAALNIPTYPDIVRRPMDLGTIDTKLKQNSYRSVSEFADDFELIVKNSVAFNGAEHAVTQQAFKMQSSFRNQMANLPKAAFSEPTREEKRAARAKVEPTRQAPPRRPSVTTATAPAPTGSARSPRSASTAQAFAPGPDGVPLIRRDSNMQDGRPKRQIVPPKRNQEFAGGRPKKKKYELQLRFCQELLKEIMNPKYWQMNQYFTHPVDPVALNIPTYFQIVKKPMDLGTIQTKLDNNVYEKAKDFEEDVRLVFKNCYKFNPEGDHVSNMGHDLEKFFDERWAKKDDWIAAREPASEPHSDADEDEDDEAESDEDDESEDERNEKIIALQKQIAEMSKQMGELTQSKKSKKKSKSPTLPPKKTKSKDKKKEKAKAQFPGLQKSDKKKSVSKPKPEKERYVTFAEKQYISNGIAMLPEKPMSEALKIIQQNVPSLANSNENEIELDIEEVPNRALLKLLDFVKKYAGPPPEDVKTESDHSAPAAGKSKKGKVSQLAGGPISPNAVQSIETGDSSDDDGDSEESEEE